VGLDAPAAMIAARAGAVVDAGEDAVETKPIPLSMRRRRTTACSDLDHHKLHAPDRHGGFEVSGSALSLWRPVADAERWAAGPHL
jgi:hypothetical protein